MTNETDYIPRQAVIDLIYYYADEACSAIVADVERMPGKDMGKDDEDELDGSFFMRRFTTVI